MTEPAQEDQVAGQKPMSDEEVMSVVSQEIDRAKDFTLGQIGKERSTAYDYYYGKLFGNEEEGRSKVVSRDVSQQIDSALPALIKFFAGSDKAVEFTPRKGEDVQVAEQATELCNYIFYTQNNGFLLLHDAFKNALLQKTACLKWYHEEKTKVSEETYFGISQEQLQMLNADPQVEIVRANSYTINLPSGQPQPGYDVAVRKKAKSATFKVVVVPPDELLVSDNAAGMEADEIPCITHRTEKTLSELVAMGYDRAEVEGLASDDSGDFTEESQSRNARTGNYVGSDKAIPDPMARKVWYCESYITLDVDRDGIAERRKVCSVGEKLLHQSVVTSTPMSFGTSKIMPHEFYGMSMADEIMDLQLLKSAVFRQTMDSLYMAITPRAAVNVGMVNLDDVLTVRPNGVIRVNGAVSDAYQPVTTPFVGSQSFPVIEYVDAEIETRTGVSRLFQGVDPNSLNKTATGVNALMNAAQARLDLIARGFAETLIKPMFKGLMELLAKHEEEARKLTVRLRNNYVPIDPRVFTTEYDMTTNVGLGTGNKDQQMQHLTNIMAVQQQVFGAFGQSFPPDQIYTKVYNAAAKLLENAGFKDATQFFPDPQTFQQPQQQVPPEVQKAQLDAQVKTQAAQQGAQIDTQKMQLDHALKQQQMVFEERMETQKAMFEAQLEQWKAQQEMHLKERLGVMNVAANMNRPQPGVNR